MTPATDVVVVGGGVIGTSSAYWLAKAGYEVVLLERRPAPGQLTTPNALGTIRTQFGTPSLVAMAQESAAFYRDIQAHLGVSHAEIGYANQGYVYLTPRPEDAPRIAESLAGYEALGVTSSVLLDQQEIERSYPFAGESVAGIFHGDGAWVNPAKIAAAWADASTGVSFRYGVDVHSITSDGSARDGASWTVATSEGPISAANVVVCAGPYSSAMLAPFGLDLPIKITPRYRAFIPDTDVDHAAAPLVINIVNGAYWRPVPGGVWLSHANVDDQEVEPGEKVTIPDGFLAEAIDLIEPVSPRLAATARAIDPADVVYAGGFQMYPADDVPIIGAVPGHDGLFMNCGHWAGVMLSPASGRLLADVVSGNVEGADNPCRVERFADGEASRSSTNKFGGWG